MAAKIIEIVSGEQPVASSQWSLCH